MVSGSGGKSKSKSQSQSSQESGTKFNQDFLDQVLNYFNPNPKATAGTFDPEKYLADNPDVAKDPYFSKNPYEHYTRHGQAEGRMLPGGSTGVPNYTGPEYKPDFIRSLYTPAAYTSAAYTPVDGGDFDKIEQNLYGGAQSKLQQAYNTSLARQREELSQAGALNSPSQYLEGSARSSLDRSFLDSLQQAARDASTTALGLKQQEAARRTGFDVGEAARQTGFSADEAARQTGYSTGEAGRETAFNEQTMARLVDDFFRKIAMALESGRYGFGESAASASGSSIEGRGGFLQS